jgi:hypothetical protein
MSDIRYLVDNNALLFIGAKRRASAFFREHCRVTEDVAYEAGTKRKGTLAPITEAMTPAILARLAEVMASVPVGDRDLVDLYGNKGAADPGMVATALVLNNPTEPSLFEPTWIVVTRDKAVLAKATEFSIATESPDGLAKMIDDA